MKKLVVFYSLEGNTRFIARRLAEETDADLLELTPVKDYPSNFIKYVKGGFQTIFKIEPEIEAVEFNPANYDLIFIGTPVWAGSFTPPIRSFLNTYNLTGKDIGLFCTYMAEEGRSITKMKQKLKENNIIGDIGFKKVLKNRQESVNKLQNWLGDVLIKVEG